MQRGAAIQHWYKLQTQDKGPAAISHRTADIGYGSIKLTNTSAASRYYNLQYYIPTNSCSDSKQDNENEKAIIDKIINNTYH